MPFALRRFASPMVGAGERRSMNMNEQEQANELDLCIDELECAFSFGEPRA
jgi:hypothetical protein